jgi:hypothetical protein
MYKKFFKEEFKKILTYKDRNIYDTDHSISRFKERFSELDIKVYYKVLKEGIDVILDVFKDSKGKYIIVSKATNVAIQLEWRLNNKSNSKINHGFTASTLDYKTQKDPIKGDMKLFVENYKKDKMERFFETKEYKQMIKETGYYYIKIPECEGYKIYIHEGKRKRNFKIIKVD